MVSRCCEWVIMRLGLTQEGEWCMVMTTKTGKIHCECQRTMQWCGKMPFSQTDWDECQSQFGLPIEWEDGSSKVIGDFTQHKTTQTTKGQIIIVSQTG